MSNNYCILRVPVCKATKKYFLSKYDDSLIDGKYIDLRKSRGTFTDFVMKNSLIQNIEKHKYTLKKPGVIYLEFLIPNIYMQYGLTEEKEKFVFRFLKLMMKDEIMFQASVFSCLPNISRTEALRLTLSLHKLNDDEYDIDSFRRFFDRFFKKFTGHTFERIRNKTTVSLKNFFIDYLDQKYKGKTKIQKGIYHFSNDTENENS